MRDVKEVLDIATAFYALRSHEPNNEAVDKVLRSWDKMHEKPVVVDLVREIERLQKENRDMRLILSPAVTVLEAAHADFRNPNQYLHGFRPTHHGMFQRYWNWKPDGFESWLELAKAFVS